MEPPKTPDLKAPADEASSDVPPANDTLPDLSAAAPPPDSSVADPVSDSPTPEAEGPGEILDPAGPIDAAPAEPAQPDPATADLLASLAPAKSEPPAEPDVSDSEPFHSVAAPIMGGAAATAVTPKPKKKRLMMALAAAGAVLVLGGASAAAYFGIYLPNQPENILKMALANSLTEPTFKTAYFDGELNVKNEAEDLDLSGDIEGKNDEKGAFEFKLDMDLFVTNLKLEARSVDGKSFFIKAGGLAGLPELLGLADDPTAKAYAPLIESLDDQWLEINESMVKEFSGSDSSMAMNQADMKQLGAIYHKHPVLKVKETLPNQTIKGMDSYHYRIVIDKVELKAFLADLKNAKIKSFESAKATLDELAKSSDSVNFDKYPFDVWINKSNKVIDQVGFSVEEEGTTMSIRVAIFDLDKPVAVEKPEGAKSILEVIGDVFGGEGGLMDTLQTDESMFLTDLENSGISL